MSLLVPPKEGLGRTPAWSGTALLDVMPRLTTTVPREYVHRVSLAEVFLTSCTRLDETRFALTGQWPRAHTYFNSPDNLRHDPLQAAETVRQTGLYLAHAEFGVPLGNPFIMSDMNWEVRPEQLAIRDTSSDLVLNAVCAPSGRAGRSASRRFELSVEICRDGDVAAVATAHFSCLSPAVYRKLRGTVPPAPPSGGRVRMRAVDVGRRRQRDVVLMPADHTGRWLLAPDLQHPIMFDHEVDHMPGMVLLEATYQASCALPGPAAPLILTQVTSEFHRFVEFSSPCWIEATALPTEEPGMVGFLVSGEQEGQKVFSAQVHGRHDAGVRLPGALQRAD